MAYRSSDLGPALAIVLALTAAFGLEMARRLRRLERRVAALEAAPAQAPLDDPPCRLTLTHPGPDPAAVEAVLVRRLSITPQTARALVGLESTQIPIPRLTPRQAEELRRELSAAGAFVSLFVKPPPATEPRETGI